MITGINIDASSPTPNICAILSRKKKQIKRIATADNPLKFKNDYALSTLPDLKQEAQT